MHFYRCIGFKLASICHVLRNETHTSKCPPPIRVILEIFVIWFCRKAFHVRLCVMMISMTVNNITFFLHNDNSQIILIETQTYFFWLIYKWTDYFNLFTYLTLKPKMNDSFISSLLGLVTCNKVVFSWLLLFEVLLQSHLFSGYCRQIIIISNNIKQSYQMKVTIWLIRPYMPSTCWQHVIYRYYVFWLILFFTCRD